MSAGKGSALEFTISGRHIRETSALPVIRPGPNDSAPDHDHAFNGRWLDRSQSPPQSSTTAENAEAEVLIIGQRRPRRQADAIFYLRTGRAKLTVVSPDGREATIALLSSGEFIGEESLRAWAGCI
jgi:hypothetical protein